MIVHTNCVKNIVTQCRGQEAKSNKLTKSATIVKIDGVGERNEVRINQPHSFGNSKSNKHACSHCGEKFGFFAEKHKKCLGNLNQTCKIILTIINGIKTNSVKFI